MANLHISTFSDDSSLSDDRLHRLAHELARNLLPAEDVLIKFGLSPETFAEVVQPNETFQRYYTESYAMWHGTANLPDRVKTKTAMILEEWLPEASRLLHDPLLNLPPKVQLAMFLGDLSGLKAQAAAAANGTNGAANNQVHVTINLGHGRQVVIEKKLDNVIEGEAEDITPPMPAQATTAVYMGEPTPPEPPPPPPPVQDLSHTPKSIPIRQPKLRAPSVRIRPTEI